MLKCSGNELFNQTKFSINEYLNPKVINDRAIAHHLIPILINLGSKGIDVEYIYVYTWILWQGKNCRQFRLLTENLLIGQFVHPVEGNGRESGWRDENV